VDKARNYEFCGLPVAVYPSNPICPQGPLTAAVGICGPELLADMLVNEDYYHRVMGLITTATIERIKAWRAYLGLDPVPQLLVFADDAIQHISVAAYRENVLPYHRKFFTALAQGGPHSIHLCGHVQRHFRTLVKELNIKSFDTGYPINFATLRDEVGEDVEIQGGVPVANLLADTPDQVYAQSVAILQSGIMRGGKFILKEANNLPPMTPPENLAAMYRAVKEVGVYHY
jgi:uroporphyrinogen decarboxylase